MYKKYGGSQSTPCMKRGNVEPRPPAFPPPREKRKRERGIGNTSNTLCLILLMKVERSFAAWSPKNCLQLPTGCKGVHSPLLQYVACGKHEPAELKCSQQPHGPKPQHHCRLGCNCHCWSRMAPRRWAVSSRAAPACVLQECWPAGGRPAKVQGQERRSAAREGMILSAGHR